MQRRLADVRAIEGLFKVMDEDGSGVVSAQEAVCYLMDHLQLSQAEARKIVWALDQDSDGQINLVELYTLVSSQFTFRARTSAKLLSVGKRRSGGGGIYDALVGAVDAPFNEDFVDLRCAVLVECHATAEQRPTRKERLAPLAAGCVAPMPAKRGLRIAQLRSTVRHISRRCIAEKWHDIHEVALSPTNVSAYDTCAYVIKPATSARRCSLVELVSDEPAMPSWFVSHYWGGAVRDLLVSLEQHSKDRNLDPNDASYWLCFAANSQWHNGDLQWCNGDESQPRNPNTASLAHSTFCAAMESSVGTVAVLGEHTFIAHTNASTSCMFIVHARASASVPLPSPRCVDRCSYNSH